MWHGNNVLNVQYTKKVPMADLQIRYIEKGNPSNVLDTINIGKPQIGINYLHTAPSTINSGGLWQIDGLTSRSYTITESSSVFTIEYTKVMVSIVIEYFDFDTDTTLHTINVPGTYQAGTMYSYTVPSIYNGTWELESGGTLRFHPLTTGTNTIRVPYVDQISPTRDVVIKYVDKSDWTNVLLTIDVGTINIGTTHNFTVPPTYTYNGLWSLDDGITSRSSLITADNYEIYVEYKEVLSTGNITIKYVESRYCKYIRYYNN